MPTGAGTVGVASVPGLAMAVVVLVPVTLNASPVFISDIGAFQALVAVLACAVGTAFVMTWLARRRRSVPGMVLALAVGLFAVVQTAVVSAHWTPLARTTFAKVGPATARTLAALEPRIPARAEVIVSQGVMGRFGGRHLVYPYLDVFADGQTVPLFGPTVYVVLVPRAGIELAPVAGTEAAVALLRRQGARQIADRNGVVAFAWHVPPGKRTVTFPT